MYISREVGKGQFPLVHIVLLFLLVLKPAIAVGAMQIVQLACL